MKHATSDRHRTRYRAPEPNGLRQAFLISLRGTAREVRYAFSETLEIGRATGEAGDPRPGLLLISDDTVSRSHCIVTYGRDGRCLVRDTSRNGTRVDGRRLMPNVEVELGAGQRLSVGDKNEFVLIFAPVSASPEELSDSTEVAPARTNVTVLIGDIRDYTGLLRRAPAPLVQQSMGRLFRVLTEEITRHGGTVKEVQGDAIVAFWEGTNPAEQAVAACRTALHVDGLVRGLAEDRSVWSVDHFPLALHWALATGPVVLDGFDEDQPPGLSMVGEAPVFAFRLEKLATDETGRILACATTHDLARGSFRFRDLGRLRAEGFDCEDSVYALEGELEHQKG